MTTQTLQPESEVIYTQKDYRSNVKPTWCPGCGDFGVLSATFKALTQLQVRPEETVIVSGIGCSSRIPYFMSTYGMHGVHGRALPLATGAKMARPDLTVMVFGGDGDTMSIGVGHLPHAAARNLDITLVMMDNQTYGLTKAQTSPTSTLGHKSKSTPYGSVQKPQNPVLFALSVGATFVARGYSARANQLADLIAQGVRHKGFSFIHVQSPCTEFHNTFDYFDSVIETLPDDWDRHNVESAMHMALTEDKTHLGVFFESQRPVFEEEERNFVADKSEFDLGRYLERFG
jgi:2-oxoglutarate/2-oxoacid ferredoxin oxidoreductase subunit beta